MEKRRRQLQDASSLGTLSSCHLLLIAPFCLDWPQTSILLSVDGIIAMSHHARQDNAL
jgi:hypothetical protein